MDLACAVSIALAAAGLAGGSDAIRVEPLAVETASFAATVCVDHLRFTKDGSPTVLWELEDRKFPVEIELVVELERLVDGEGRPIGMRRHYRAASISVDGEAADPKPFLLGRTVDRLDAKPELALVDFDETRDTTWTDCRSLLERGFAPWVPIWSDLSGSDPDLSARSPLRRSFAIPGGIAQALPPRDGAQPSIVRGWVLLLDGCFAAPLDESAPGPQPTFASKPEIAVAFTDLWSAAWSNDLGRRDVRDVKSDLRFVDRSKIEFGAKADCPGSRTLTGRGTADLDGEITFTTDAAIWPAAWTCTLDVKLDWRTDVEWIPAAARDGARGR